MPTFTGLLILACLYYYIVYTMKKIRLFSLFAFYILPLATLAQTPADVLLKKLEKNDSLFHRQEIVALLSNNQFFAGDKIHFSAWVQDAKTERLDEFSSVLNAEIINPKGKVVLIKLLKLEKGHTAGFFLLPDSMGAGTYRLRLWTPFMRNFHPQFMGLKSFEVYNTEKPFYDTEYLQFLKKLRRQRKRIKSLVYTESKYLKAGIQNRVGLAISNSQNKKIKFSAKIIDNKKNVVAESSGTAGLELILFFVPEMNRRYKVIFYTASGKRLKEKLPKVVENNLSIIAKNITKNKIDLQFSSATNKSTKQYLLTVSNRGGIHFSQPVSFKNKFELSIMCNKLPRGMLSFILYNLNSTVPEEQVFINIPKRKSPKLDLIINSKGNELSIEFPKNERFSGNYTVLVKGKKQVRKAAEGVIVEKYPEFKILEINKKKYFEKKMELTASKFTRQDKITISGTVTRELIKLPYKNATVKLYILNKHNDRFTTHTNTQGQFSFSGMDYSDTLDVIVEARTVHNGKSLIIYPDYYAPFLAGQLIPNNIDSAIALQKRGRRYMRYYRQEVFERDTFDVTGKKLHRNADQVIDYRVLNNGYYSNVSQVLDFYLPAGSIRGQDDPLFLIDGTPSDRATANTIPVSDIERIEILKSPGNKAIYGFGGKNGVIAIYTKHGNLSSRGEIHFKILGFSEDKAFAYMVAKSVKIQEQTLVWKTLVAITNTKKTLKFNWPEYYEEVIVTVQGFTNEGKPICFEKQVKLNP